MIKKDKLLAKLKEIDDMELIGNVPDNVSIENFSNFSRENIKQEIKAILGLDIYKYSDYEDEKQSLIPLIFDLLLDNTCQYTCVAEKTLSKDINIQNNFIPTGDGGFIIFQTPLHALVFNLYFFAVLHIFNSGHFSPRLSKYIGELNIRSTITYDNVFNYENNWYGKAIIKNSRILSRDKLNRFLIDEETYNYFMKKFNGIETLSIIKDTTFKQIMNIRDDFHSILFDGRNNNLLRNIHIQKVEETWAKNTKLNIYNLEIQFHATSSLNDNEVSYIFTLGNSNVANITNK
ncbi:MAG: hypothetical protein LBI90_03980 [Treponema sp.]|jgi:hypothetical protein|nr:hypothetical protein [Treponema sp.]